MARVDDTRLLPLARVAARGQTVPNLQVARVATAGSDQSDFCASEFVWMSSTRWNDQNLFLTTLKIRLSPKTLLFSDERALIPIVGGRNHWWWL
jgi:hypothetical protein